MALETNRKHEMTVTDLQSKTDEELNVMLAELVGWTVEKTEYFKVLYPPGDKHYGFCCGLHLSDDEVWKCGVNGDELGNYRIPRYCSFLDEVARVEAGLDDVYPNHQSYDYINYLREIVGGVPNCPAQFCATARQRTLALISTLTKTP